MYLERILGTTTKINAIFALISHAGGKFTETELSRESGCALSELNRQMGDLVSSGLVTMERAGRSKLYAINKSHFLYKPLLSLFSDLNGTFLSAAKAVSKEAVRATPDLEAVVLYGSVAKKSVRQDLVSNPSDIDLLLILRSKKDREKLDRALTSGLMGGISSKYGIIGYPIILTREEYLERLKNKDPLIIAVHAEGMELYGKKPKRFG